ncbi:MAG: HAD family hydrolase [Polyangiaceae bacterium]|nr:HAD family hydrolase [Polyangiaceae bacterium]
MGLPTDLRAVLLDIDGTLVDSNDAHAGAWQKALLEFGHDVSKSAIRDWIGKGGDRLLPELTGIAEASKEGRAISARRKELFRDHYLPKLRMFPRADELVVRMFDQGLLLAAATSATRSEVLALLKIAGVDDLIHVETTADDVSSSKPAPDVVNAALEMLRVPPERAVFIGDTPYDVEAGLRAGVPVIAVESGGWSGRDLKGAIEVYRDVEDLHERWDESFFGTGRMPAPRPRHGRMPRGAVPY